MSNKFRKKPLMIEAIHWDGHKVENVPDWISEALNKPIGEPGNIYRQGRAIEICTLEGIMTASPGDWIIRGVDGELYPCKPDIFLKTYETVSASPAPHPGETPQKVLRCIQASKKPAARLIDAQYFALIQKMHSKRPYMVIIKAVPDAHDYWSARGQDYSGDCLTSEIIEYYEYDER